MPALRGKQSDDAEEQIRKVHLKMVDWAIAFSQTSLEGFNANQLLQVKKDIYEFLYGAQRFLQGSDTRRVLKNSTDQMRYIHQKQIESFASRLSVRQIHKVQSRLLHSLNEFVYHSHPGTLSMGAKRVVFAFSWSTLQSPFVWDVLVHDVVPAAVIALGAHLVGSRITPDHLRRCPEPHCGIIFLASRKPRADRELHCSIECARNAARRRYRERNRASIQLKDRARKKRRYDARIRERFPGARIGIQRT